MADDLITIQLRLTGGTAAAAEARKVEGAISGMGRTTSSSTAAAEKSTSKFRSTLSSLGRTVAYSSIPVIGALGYELGRSVNAYREARKVTQETNARIKSTGEVANVTAQQVGKLSSTLALKTGVDDEEIQTAANMLLTFKDIRNEVGKGNDIFDQATQATLDLAAASKIDGVSAAKQLGKALNDPTTGLTALRRSGASFNAEQTEMIQKLFDSGHRLKAQKMILKELSTEFAGSARSQHDSIDRLGQAWEELEEQLGKVLYPVLQDVTQWLTKVIRQAQHGKGPLIDLKNTFSDVGGAIKFTVDRINDFITPFRTAVDLMEKWRDLTRQLILDPSQIDPAFSSASDLALGVPQPGHHGSGTTPSTGHPQNKRPSLEPVPKTSTAGSGAVLHIHNRLELDGKVVARNTTKHALKAKARA